MALATLFAAEAFALANRPETSLAPQKPPSGLAGLTRGQGRST